MLGQPQSMLLPEVIGFKLTGSLPEGVTATDLVLTVTQMLRKKGVVGKFVEFYGDGLNHLTLADRATIANMAPGIWRDLRLLPRRRGDAELSHDVEPLRRRASRSSRNMPRKQGMFRTKNDARPGLHRHAATRSRRGRALDGGPEAAGRPHRARRRGEGLRRRDGDRVQAGARISRKRYQGRGRELRHRPRRRRHRGDHVLHQHVEPERADRRGPARAQRGREGLDLEAVGEDLARARQPGRRRISRQGRACRSGSTSSASTSSATAARPASAIPARSPRRSRRRSTTTASSPPPFSPATAISRAASARTCRRTISPRRRSSSPMRSPAPCRRISRPSRSAHGKDGKPVYLRDIWPTSAEIQSFIRKNVTKAIFKAKYASVFDGDTNWKKVKVPTGETYRWEMGSTYVQNPPYFEGITMTPKKVTDIVGARILALFGDKITTDHISPAGSIKVNSPAGKWLTERQVVARRLQPVRHAPRQSRSDDARHVREHPHQELHHEGRQRQCAGRRHDEAFPGRRADVDLRCRDEVSGRSDAARDLRRRRIRQRLVARLGGEGHAPARRARRDRAEFRAHPSLEPRRHGRAAAGVLRRHELGVARTARRRARDDPRSR